MSEEAARYGESGLEGIRLKPVERCSLCRFFLPRADWLADDGEPDGRCRKGRPSLEGAQRWPSVYVDDWCGEFERKEQA